MKTKLRSIVALACASVCALSFTACSAGRSKQLGAPKAVEPIEYDDAALGTDEYKALLGGVESFAAKFAASAYADYNGQENFAVSPISVYSALALSAECAAGDTRGEILDALGVTYEQLKAEYATLYRSLAVEHKWRDNTTGLVNFANSIWVNNGTKVNKRCIDALSDDFYAYSYSADFKRDNAGANKAVRSFVKEQTKGLIDKDFELGEETLFTLINALYLKTIWQEYGRDLPMTKEYDFTDKDGNVCQVQYLIGKYIGGRVAQFDTYSTFYTRTLDGYKIKFILPNDGYTVDDVFTAENVAAVNAITDYNYYDEENNVRYETCTLFPEYECAYDENVKGILQGKLGIDLLFKDHINNVAGCDFSTLTDASCYCSEVRHATTLTVDRKGIKGAAVTVEILAGDAMPPETIKEEFIVDKAFGFIITDWQDVTLFSGVVNNV